MHRISFVVVSVLVANLAVASADPDPDFDDDDDAPPRIGIAIAESAALVAATAGWYEHTLDQQRKDFDLEWDRDSWRRKLTFDAVRFDTNEFSTNAVHHPLMSTVQYHIARTNRFGLFGSELFAATTGVLWEYLVEYREYPSINDLIINATAGLEIGEPLWQIGQLWRGGVMTVGDRVKTAVFSPLDTVHDLARRKHFRWWRPTAWRSIAVDGGVLARFDDTKTHGAAVVSGDIDLVADRHYVTAGEQGGMIKAGSWSRIRSRLQIGDAGSGTELVGTLLESRTSVAGRYSQDGYGRGIFVGVGTAFTYRRDRLAAEWDHVAIAHVVGPQLQISQRQPSYAVRWDLAMYGDFAMIDAHVFGLGSPFPKPPPYETMLQAQGYYPGLGATATTRLRFDIPHWTFDGELSGHQIWQIDAGDRVGQPSATRTTMPADPHGCADLRFYARAQFGYRYRRYGLDATAEGEVRNGSWHDVERQTSGGAIGLLGHVDL